MAKNRKPSDAKNSQVKSKKQKGPEKKPGLGKRFRNFINGLYAELKRVVWPDKKQMKQTFTAGVIVNAIAAVTVFVVDSILQAGLRASGFEDPVNQAQVSPTPVPTEETTSTVEITEPTEDSED